MIRALVLGLLILFLVTVQPAEAATDWCYRYDFTGDDFSITPTAGTWVPGVGFVSDGSGYLNIALDHSATVSPHAVMITFARAPGVIGYIGVNATPNIFGLAPGLFQSSIPEVLDHTWLKATVSGFVSGTGFTISAIATRGIAIEDISVAGDGENPFPAHNCTDVFSKDLPATPIPVPIGEIQQAITEAEEQLAEVDRSLTVDADGNPLLPQDNSVILFGYAKWVTSPGAAQELFGPFDGIVTHLGILLSLNFALAAVYLVIYAVTYLIRWALWLFHLAVKIAEAIVLAPVVLAVLAIAAAIVALVAAISALAGGG